ncbi:MAG TPA: type II toxin-antitoxin system prevent-host-death family antitoxin [Longimicrobium sp.]
MVTFAVELAEMETRLARLIQEVATGAEVVITRNGEPVARLVPPSGPLPDRVPGSAKGLFTVPDDFDEPLEDFRDYM